MRTAESIFEFLAEFTGKSPYFFFKYNPTTRNIKSKIYKNPKGAHVNRYKQLTKIS